MKPGASQNLGKGRPAGEPGAKAMGINNGAAGNRPPAEHEATAREPSWGKNHGSLGGGHPGTFAGAGARSLLGKNAKNSSELGPLGRNDLIREIQAIVLQFPTKQVAEEQDSTTKAVERQRNGDSAMSLLAAVNMARSNPRARAMFGKLFGFAGCHTDPDFMEGMEKLAHGYLRQQFVTFGFAPEQSGASAAQAKRDSSLNSAGEDKDVLTGDLFEAMGNA